nr:type II secretion system protein [Paraglaciecola sp. G1-23]
MFRFKKKGFTLIELLIVMVIMGLVSSLVLPSLMRQVESAREIAELEKLKNIVGLLKVQTFFSGRVFKFEFNEQLLVVKESSASNLYVDNEELALREFKFDYLNARTPIEYTFNANNSASLVYLKLSTVRGSELTLEL